jgi:hypothetical protein
MFRHDKGPAINWRALVLYPAWQPALQAPDLVRLLFLFDKNSLVIAFRTLVQLATSFFFISTFFTVPDRHTKLLSFEDDYGLI